MKFLVLTIFPNLVQSALSESILARAIKSKAISVTIKDIRDFAKDKHKSVDDAPYGGGAGMVMRVDILDEAISWAKKELRGARVALLTPQGERFTQETAEKLAGENKDLILVAGHYEGFDERARSLVDLEISIGDFVVTGGELPAVLIIDAVSRLLPGVLGKEESSKEESFSLKTDWGERMIEYPHYTRPEEYKGQKVPKVLLSGNHMEIKRWRRQHQKRIKNSPEHSSG